MRLLRRRGQLQLLAAIAVCLMMTAVYYRERTGVGSSDKKDQEDHRPNNIQHQLNDNAELVSFWRRKHSSYFGYMPSIYDVEYNNKHWQVFRTSNVTMFVYSAFYDQRHHNETYIRIVTLIKNSPPTTTASYCQFWFEDVPGIVSTEVTLYNHLWEKKWGNPGYDHLHPYVVSCGIPASLRGHVPVGVSLATGPRTRATTLLPVVNTAASSSTGRDDFVVCVKGLNYIYNDISQRIIEWLEVMRAVGVSKVFMYEFALQPNVQRVLLEYQDKGFVELRETTLPDTLPNDDLIRHLFFKDKITDKRQIEVIIYNDCFYRSVRDFKYVALLDIDEIIFPVKHTTWKNMKLEIDRNISLFDASFSPSCYCFHNYYFSSDTKDARIPDGVSIASPSFWNQTRRALHPTQSGSYTKCLHDTRAVLAVHNHYPLYCLDGQPCSRHFVDTSVGRLNHYRGRCPSELTRKGKCPLEETVFDDSIIKLRDKVEQQLAKREPSQ